MSKNIAGIHSDRIKNLNEKETDQEGTYVLYWMQQSQRTEWNHALEYAARMARQLEQPLLVGFGLTADYPDANARHYTFMLEGLKQVSEKLKERKTKLVVRKGHPAEVALELGERASAIVCDRGYLRHQRAWREEVAEKAGCSVVQVESDLIVPVESASDKQEYAARTIRKKLMGQYEDYLDFPDPVNPPKDGRYLNVSGIDLRKPEKVIEDLDVDHSVEPVSKLFKGGTTEAVEQFDRFLENHLKAYDDHRNQPQTDHVSHMSKYLHFGQISPVYLADKIRSYGSGENVDSFIEELLVRRELAANYCFYNDQYDSFEGLPDWALKTLNAHASDPRPTTYSLQQLEAARTDDPYWNAAMREMKLSGYMHNYMRMYWGKRILSWVGTPSRAYEITLHLNNKYFLDGRDCNSYANVSWIFGLHDRAWQERDIYGKVRIMTQSGLKRKFDPDAYVEKVDKLEEEVE
ncbi:MAG: deoxyribodipyrimidine photo-lyase [Saprospiraceae bacterium]|nr:deoxyribodipyrimidine photo-lyase [Saprospiraceae bacterium]